MAKHKDINISPSKGSSIIIKMIFIKQASTHVFNALYSTGWSPYVIATCNTLLNSQTLRGVTVLHNFWQIKSEPQNVLLHSKAAVQSLGRVDWLSDMSSICYSEYQEATSIDPTFLFNCPKHKQDDMAP